MWAMQCASVPCFLPPLGRGEARRGALAGRGLRERRDASARVYRGDRRSEGRSEASVSQPSWHP